MQRATALCNINSNSYSTQGLQHHQQLVTGIYGSKNTSRYYNRNASNNNIITKTRNHNHTTNSMNNFYHSNTNTTNNNSCDCFHPSNIKNDNGYIEGSKIGSNLDQNICVLSLYNTNLNHITDNNNGNTNTIEINNTNSRRNNFVTQLVPMNDNGNMNVNSNRHNILSCSNQMTHGNILNCLHQNKVKLLCRLRQLELFVVNNHKSNNILSQLTLCGLFGSMHDFSKSKDLNIRNTQLSQLRSQIEIKQRELQVLSMLKDAPNMMETDTNNIRNILHIMQCQAVVPSNQVMLTFLRCNMFFSCCSGLYKYH